MKNNKNTILAAGKKEFSNKKSSPKSKAKVSKTTNSQKVEKFAPEKVTEVIKEGLVKIVATEDAQIDVKGKHTKKQKKNKKEKLELKLLEKEEPTPNGNNKDQLEVEDLAKIEKKKAKKLAQKLKKQQKKAANAKEINSEVKSPQKSPKSKITKSEKKVPNDENTTSTKKIALQKPTTNLKKLRKAEKKREQKALKDNEDEEPKKPRNPAAFEVATVFVGNLPVNTKRVQLVRLFKDYGPISAIRIRTAGGKLIMKHKQRKEAGTLNAYLVLKDKETAERAIALNGTEFKSNHLRVTLADKNSHNTCNTDAKHMVFIGNLKFSATDEKLREIFSSCGEIEYVRCLRNGEKGCNGVAYVCFKTPEAVGLALELNETMLDERPIHVERYSVKKLGAKEKRDSTAASQANKKPATGAKKRLDQKNKKHGNNKSTPQIDGDIKKKTEFRGVKVDGIKKKQKQKKKPTSQLKQLAKKIAPKPQ